MLLLPDPTENFKVLISYQPSCLFLWSCCHGKM